MLVLVEVLLRVVLPSPRSHGVERYLHGTVTVLLGSIQASWGDKGLLARGDLSPDTVEMRQVWARVLLVHSTRE